MEDYVFMDGPFYTLGIKRVFFGLNLNWTSIRYLLFLNRLIWSAINLVQINSPLSDDYSKPGTDKNLEH